MGRHRRQKEKQRADRGAGNPPAISNKEPSALRKILLHLFLLAVVTFGLYGGSLRNGFVADDNFLVLGNRLITDPQYIPKLFTSNLWVFAQSRRSNYYRPLQLLAYMGEYSLYGTLPWAWHLFHLLAHLAAVFAGYAVVRALSDARLALWSSLWFAFLAVHVEAVVWVAAPDLFCAFALFASVHFYHRGRTASRSWPFHLLATASFFAALLCKETAIVFPALLVAYEFFYRRESLVNVLRGLPRLIPYAGALGVYLAMRLHALGSFAPVSGSHYKLSPKELFLSAPALLGKYVEKVLFPVNLNYFYVFHPARTLGWPSAAGLVLLVILASATFLLRKGQPFLAFAIVWFLATLAPVLSISNVGENVFAERYLYIPSFGACICFAWAMLELFKTAPKRAVRRTLYAAVTAIFALYAVQTIRRIPDWQDDLALYSKTAEQSPDAASIQSDLGTAYFSQGDLDKALDHYQRAVSLDPNLAMAQFNLGIALRDKGQPEEALVHVLKAVELDHERDASWGQYGMALANLKQWDQAIECYRKALLAEPEDPAVLTRLGIALSSKGDREGASQAYRQAIAAQPGYLDASLNLAIFLMRSGKFEEASILLAVALQKNPDAPHADLAHFNLGLCYEKKERWDRAALEYESALRLNHDFPAAEQRLELARRQAQAKTF
jgi:tetratricopeptide (TPR) repeat protein